MKRGRPPLPPASRREVRVTVAVTSDVADAMYVYAQRHREPLSKVLSGLFERIAAREKQLGITVDSRITTP